MMFVHIEMKSCSFREACATDGQQRDACVYTAANIKDIQTHKKKYTKYESALQEGHTQIHRELILIRVYINTEIMGGKTAVITATKNVN